MAFASSFRPNDKVFVDGSAGLVQAVVVSTDLRLDKVTVRYTAKRDGRYKTNSTETWPAQRIIMREWVHERAATVVVREPRRSNPSRGETAMVVGAGAGALGGGLLLGGLGAVGGAIGGAIAGAMLEKKKSRRERNPSFFANPWGER